jgi:hypothetical protein
LFVRLCIEGDIPQKAGSGARCKTLGHRPEGTALQCDFRTTTTRRHEGEGSICAPSSGG